MGITPDSCGNHTTQPWEDAAEVGIHRIRVPTPFAVGATNAYLIEDDPLTLIDSGPNWALSLDALDRSLRELGHTIPDLGLLVITHPHMDHLGLAGILARRSGAPVAALEADRAHIEEFAAEAAADNAFIEWLMTRHGFDPTVALALRVAADVNSRFGASTHIDTPLQRVDAIKLRDRTLRTLHRPGHSPADIVLIDESTKIGFTGDHLIAHISANPLAARPLGASREYRGRPASALVDMFNSLQATTADAIRLGLPGHGEPVTDVNALTVERISGYEARSERIVSALSGGPTTAFEIACRIWGYEIVVTQGYLTLSEILSHTDVLIERKRIVEDASDQVVRFRLAEASFS